jgi:probable rRNA maturation factor
MPSSPPRYRVAISDQQSTLNIDRAWVRKVVRRALKDETVASAEISIAIVDDTEMRELNRRHLNHDYETDVLSFVLEVTRTDGADNSAPAGDSASAPPRRGRGLRIEGEIIVSTDTAAREGPLHGWSAEHELTLYLVHGLLHLCGYDDKTGKELSRMRTREAEILKFFGLTPHYTN